MFFFFHNIHIMDCLAKVDKNIFLKQIFAHLRIPYIVGYDEILDIFKMAYAR